MKLVTVTLKLKLDEDQPAVDWIPELIQRELRTGEELVVYTDDEPVESA